MRCVQSARFGYIFNPWSDGERVFRNESQAGRTFAAMREAAATSPEIAARIRLFLQRVQEELYDFAADPDARSNRVADAARVAELAALRVRLEQWMEATGDPALGAFRCRDSRDGTETFMHETATRLGGNA